LDIKLDNLCRVIIDLSPDVLGLQEVESEKALKKLQDSLRRLGENFPYAVIAAKKPATVKCALLSKYPVIRSTEIPVPGGSRSLLRADLDVSGNRLIVFVNHWKSKNGPESRRIAYARALAAAADELPEKSDYILMGDFNSNYDEFLTIRDRPVLDDTRGVIGINHVLKTLSGDELVGEKELVKKAGQNFHYNLWLEVCKERRWSALFFGRPASPDAILLPAALYDGKGVSYLDNSFDKFDPGYVFDGHRLLRWQRTERGKGRHLGIGFSDHLPVYACFTEGPFDFRDNRAICSDKYEDVSIADLYNSKTGAVNLELKHCAVIYRHGDNAVIKQKNGRAVYVYKEGQALKEGCVYDITVSRLKCYYGNLEITGIESTEKTGEVKKPGRYYIGSPNIDLSARELENEVIGKYCGTYKKDGFYYGKGRQIRLYFKIKSLEPEPNTRICLKHVRIGYHKSPELVIEKPEQIKLIELNSADLLSDRGL
ncbi:MAG: endonuclease/exonuclease/phosphatase family protein, partial [Desulfobacteraceae bacterium]|nr:endonuclease/exonuclease/phosphatase family protein [Desulfobacteraceae bacterium]